MKRINFILAAALILGICAFTNQQPGQDMAYVFMHLDKSNPQTTTNLVKDILKKCSR